MSGAGPDIDDRSFACARVADVMNQIRTDRHFSALDGLRGLAILLVIPHNADAFHGTLWPAAILAHLGWIGVQLFFVLSGFLITGNLLDSRNAPNYYKSFFARRVLRIFPLYYGVLIVTFLVLPHFTPLPEKMVSTQHHQIWLWTFLVNWTEPFGRSVEGFSHFWSLAVEEQFYLIWPFLLHRRNPETVFWLSVGLIVAAFIIRCVLLLNGARTGVLYMFTFCRMDALAAGAAAAALVRIPRGIEVFRRHSHRWWRTGLILAILGTLPTGIYALEGTGTYTVGYTILSLAFAAFVLGGIAEPTGSGRFYQKILNLRPLRSVGRYSYGMYIFHMFIIVGAGGSILARLRPVFPIWYPAVYALVIAVLSYCVAFVSYHGFEKHFLKLKRRFTPVRSAALQPST